MKRKYLLLLMPFLLFSLLGCGTRAPSAEVSNVRTASTIVRFNLTTRDRSSLVDSIEVRLIRSDDRVLDTIKESDGISAHGLYNDLQFHIGRLQPGTYDIAVVVDYTEDDIVFNEIELDRISFEISDS